MSVLLELMHHCHRMGVSKNNMESYHFSKYFSLCIIGSGGGRGRPREDDGRHRRLEESTVECKGV